MYETLNIALLIKFLVVVIFGFLTGLELREYYSQKQGEVFSVGTTRTFTFIAMLGFVLYLISFQTYMLGLFVLSIFLSIFYVHKLKIGKKGILTILISLITYSFSGIEEKSIFYIPLIYVSIVFILSSQPKIQQLTQKINNEELITLAKFLLLSVVILPILPDNNVIPYVSVSPFKIWLAVVVVSSISYMSYILQKYFFPRTGIMITGILGGIYSSTATTVVLAKKGATNLVQGSIVVATGVMYLRLLAIVAIFNFTLSKSLFLPSVSLFLASLIIFYFLKENNKNVESDVNSNPLELQVASIFAGLFILMAVLTKVVVIHFGNTGLQALSAIVGFTDIDPFILSLIQGKYAVTQNDIIQAILIAASSNNILKAIYTGIFSKWQMKKAMFNLLFLAVLTLGWVVYFHYFH
jgi:uncharacterized membrane protein (DUF4010 family)